MKQNGLQATDAALEHAIEEKAIEIPPLGLNWLTVEVRGIRPLIVHKFSEKARKQMEQKQQKQAKQKKEARNPQEEARAALYMVHGDNGKPKDPAQYGFPAAGIKKSMVGSCRHIDGIPMTVARGAFHVYGDGHDEDGRDLIVLQTPGWKMRSDVVRLESGVASIAYRPEFSVWGSRIRIRYVASSITPQQLIHMLNVAGFTTGIGENRPERSGDTFGQFEVVTNLERS